MMNLVPPPAHDFMQWVWAAWILVIVASFAALEGYALWSGHWTLSRSTWVLAKEWPPLAVVYGIIFGGLAVHFFWVNQGLGK